jgi:rfaE bifunctional protein nucleotidyltransferase chain/domain
MQLWQDICKKKYIDPTQLESKTHEIRKSGLSIATLNGSFDLMHAGHLHIIYEASQTADVLIVALNTDESIKKYKNANRPIIPLRYRLQMMAAVEFVDFVTWFEETDPRKLLDLIKPNVHVNGAEYGETCIEAETIKKYGQLHIVNLIPDLSTTQILTKIVKAVNNV